MTHFDVFNGDADGIISLIQLRLNEPKQSVLITGVKRDITLLQQVDASEGDRVTVLDISMEKNCVALEQALNNGANVFYADHHRSGSIPESKSLDAHIDLDANTCTALIIDKLLGGKYHAWAITAAYGDNLIAKADQLAEAAGLSQEQKLRLKELGILINYNGYGAELADLHFSPADLYQALYKYSSPFDVFEASDSPYYKLKAAYERDLASANSVKPSYQGKLLTLIHLPNETWSKRISGVYGNLLANQAPERAHAVLTPNADNSYLVSLRAPLNNKCGAGDICNQFLTGGGRAGAAGINRLEADHVQRFIDITEDYYSKH
ncbi:DHH family phosphoesterase [Shewanella maritima]|uniref:DHH family phosphoesterase n=1 Tax=Shewanella maritima TaxID=2520507 RepID=A0A411PE80_9GAMM|nr:DHH family phosphoesterase [Shewanella maritima]QBF81843.1 DHH family phosphoesterase [Shewanella maritima]